MGHIYHLSPRPMRIYPTHGGVNISALVIEEGLENGGLRKIGLQQDYKGHSSPLIFGGPLLGLKPEFWGITRFFNSTRGVFNKALRGGPIRVGPWGV